MKISVVIPAYNEEHYIGPCIQSVQEQHSEDIVEIIVVDNGSKDDTVATAKKFKGVTVLQESKKGPSHARQLGFTQATGDHIAFIDADTRVPAGWVDRIKKEFAKDPALVCLSGPSAITTSLLYKNSLRNYYGISAPRPPIGSSDSWRSLPIASYSARHWRR